jgi:glycerophosphoryl diester phosphodiesterase
MEPFVILLFVLIDFLLLSFLVYLFLIAPTGKRRDRVERFKGVYFAHRGLHNEKYPENSLGAFREAAEAGYGIELDIRLSSDGELVVFHDDTLDRVTKETGRVDGRSAEELGKIKLLGTDETIPTFREVLALVDGRVPLLVEIKEDAGKYSVTEKAVEMLSEYSGEFIVESFNPLALARLKKKMPDAVRGVLSENFLEEKKYRKPMYFLLQCLVLNVICRPDFIAFNHKHYKNASLRLARRLFSVPTFAWTVRSEREETDSRLHGFDAMIFENYLPKNNSGVKQ